MVPKNTGFMRKAEKADEANTRQIILMQVV